MSITSFEGFTVGETYYIPVKIKSLDFGKYGSPSADIRIIGDEAAIGTVHLKNLKTLSDLLSAKGPITIDDSKHGVMPWRLQIASKLYPEILSNRDLIQDMIYEKKDVHDFVLKSADALIEAHMDTLK